MSITALIILLLGVASGSSTILYENLVRCRPTEEPSASLQEAMSHLSRYLDIHCYEDNVTGFTIKCLINFPFHAVLDRGFCPKGLLSFGLLSYIWGFCLFVFFSVPHVIT